MSTSPQHRSGSADVARVGAEIQLGARPSTTLVIHRTRPVRGVYEAERQCPAESSSTSVRRPRSGRRSSPIWTPATSGGAFRLLAAAHPRSTMVRGQARREAKRTDPGEHRSRERCGAERAASGPEHPWRRTPPGRPAPPDRRLRIDDEATDPLRHHRRLVATVDLDRHLVRHLDGRASQLDTLCGDGRSDA